MDREFRKKLVGSYLLLVATLWGLLLYSFKRGIWLFSPPDQEVLALAITLMAAAFIPLILFLLVGLGRYVYVDAKARGMNGVLWSLVVIFIPYFIGLIVYLIVRSPLLICCSGCLQNVHQTASFCPQCGHILKKQCTTCRSTLDARDRFCSQCGTMSAAQS